MNHIQQQHMHMLGGCCFCYPVSTVPACLALQVIADNFLPKPQAASAKARLVILHTGLTQVQQTWLSKPCSSVV